MSMKRRSADQYGVTQWFADGRRAGLVRNPRVTLAIAIPMVLAVVGAAIALAGPKGGIADTANTAFRGANAGDVATAPVDGAGNAINLNQTADQAAASLNCTLTVPANPLSAQGLATPWQLGDGCQESNVNLQAFVEATILSPNGQLQVYNPLVVTQGTQPAAAPAAPAIAQGSQVVVDIGFNGTNLALTGAGATQGHCVDALGQSLIGQVSACNAAAFYQMANSEIARGTLKVPAVGTAKDGKPCLVTRDFGMIDQDQSDNVNTVYLLNANGQTAQDTAANAQAMAGVQTIVNGSDNALLTKFLDGALGCTPFTAPSTTTAAGTAAAQALDELSARQSTPNPAALVPPNDEMVLVGGQPSIAKTNVYRSLVDQAPLGRNTNAAQAGAAYCQNMVDIQPARSQLDMNLESGTASPVPAVGSNLATFLGNRLSMSFTNLGCQNYGLTDPVTVTVDGNQVATAVTYNTAQQTATTGGTGATACATPTASASASPAASATATPTTSASATPTASASPAASASAAPSAGATPSASANVTASASTAPAVSASAAPSAPATACPAPSPTMPAKPASHGHRHSPRNGGWQNPSGM